MADNFTPVDDYYKSAVKNIEGFMPNAGWDYKQHTNGYGTRASHPGEKIDRITAQLRFDNEFDAATRRVDSFAPGLDPGTRAALASLTFNSGTKWQSSGLGRAIQQGNMPAARALFNQYVRAGGNVLPGLERRRSIESGWWGTKPDASAVVAALRSGDPQQVAAARHPTPADQQRLTALIAQSSAAPAASQSIEQQPNFANALSGALKALASRPATPQFKPLQTSFRGTGVEFVPPQPPPQSIEQILARTQGP